MPGESRSSPREIQNYLGRISGPLLDRIDLHVEVPPVKFREITSERTGEASAQIRERVIAARRRQHARFRDRPKITCNARMGSRELKQYCELDEATLHEFLVRFPATIELTVAAMIFAAGVGIPLGRFAGDHISEAIQYRSLDRQIWT